MLRAGPDTCGTATTPVSQPVTRPPEARTGSELGLGSSRNEIKRLDRGHDRQKRTGSQLWRRESKTEAGGRKCCQPALGFWTSPVACLDFHCVSEPGGVDQMTPEVASGFVTRRVLLSSGLRRQTQSLKLKHLHSFSQTTETKCPGLGASTTEPDRLTAL